MSTNKHESLIRRLYELADRGDFDSAEALFLPESVMHTAGRVLDRVGIRQAMANDLTAMPNLQTTVDELITEVDLVAARLTRRGTHSGALKSVSGVEVAATGKSVIITGQAMFRISDGHIAEMWQELDRLSLLQQIGAVTQAGLVSHSPVGSARG